MSLSTKTLLCTTANADNLSAVEANVAIPENCHTITIFNPDTTNLVYVAEDVAGAAPLSSSTSKIIDARGTYTITMGTLSTRVQRSMVLVYSTSAANIDVNIAYLCTNII